MQNLAKSENRPVGNSPKPCLTSVIDRAWIRINQLLAETFPPKFRAGAKPTTEQIANTLVLIADTRDLLSLRATPADVAKIFALLAGGMAARKGDEAAISAQAYTDALAHRSSWAIGEAYSRIIEGEAKEFSQTFLPTAPELSQFCKKIEENMRAKLDRIEAILDAPEEQAGGASISAEKFDELIEKFKQVKGEAA